MDDSFIQGFLSGFDDSRFPEGFLADYDALECFAQNEAGETLFVRARQTGAYFVAKCYADKSLLSHMTERRLRRSDSVWRKTTARRATAA